MRRREFAILPAKSLGGLLLYTLAGEPLRVQTQDGTVRLPLRFFTAAEARVVAAACERIFPSDQSGPGATEAGVVIYIDRQLAGPYGRDKYRYTKGPFVESVPEHGYQGQANPQQIYREGVRRLGNFGELPPAEQDERLRAIEKTPFFEMLRTHTIGHVLRPTARRQCGPDRMATGGISRAADELPRGDRQESREALAAQTGELGAGGGASGEGLGGGRRRVATVRNDLGTELRADATNLGGIFDPACRAGNTSKIHETQ